MLNYYLYSAIGRVAATTVYPVKPACRVVGHLLNSVKVMATPPLLIAWNNKFKVLFVAAVVSHSYVQGVLQRLMAYIRRQVGPRLFTWVFDASGYRSSHEALRGGFRSMTLPVMHRPVGAHSHQVAACDRSAANLAIDTFIKTAGYSSYSVSMSARDITSGNSGNRYFHHAKDVAMASVNDVLGSSHIIKFIDVDYYCHMRDYAALGNPMLIYTFVPRRTAGKVLDGTYAIEKDSVNVIVDGGASYTHQLWDYDTDSLVFDYWWGSVFYLLESVQTTDSDRRIVGLFPVRVLYGPLGWFMPGKRLNRRQFQHGNLNINRYQVGGEVRISISRPGHRCDVDVIESLLLATLIRCESKDGNGYNTAIADIERMVKASNVEDPHVQASLLYSYLDEIRPFLHLPILSNTGKAVDNVHYQTLHPLVTEDGTPSVRTVGPRFCQGNVAPMRSVNNDTSCVIGRIENVRNKETTWPAAYHKYGQEFLNFLVPDDLVHTGIPWSNDQVMDAQSRPTQRRTAIAAAPFAYTYKLVVSSFQKTETYPGVKHPRNISTVNADHRTRYGGFIYPLTETLLKPQKWYAFGKTPIEIAHAVHELSLLSEVIIGTDFSSWDGTHSSMLCDYEEMVLRRFFHPVYHVELIELFRSQFKAKAFTKHDVQYNTMWSRLSGSSDTSAFNSLNNALIAYFVLRECGQSPGKAWEKLGLYGGDDGLSICVTASTYERVARRMGHILKAEVMTFGQFVPFLGRYFLDPWTTTESVIDIQRQLRRLHLTTAPPTVPADVAIYRRAQAMLITDPTTPFLSEWAITVLRLLPHLANKKLVNSPDQSWFSKFDKSVQWPTPMYGSQTHDLAIKLFCEQVGVDTSDMIMAIQRMMSVSTWEEFMDLKIFFEALTVEISVSAQYRGELVSPVQVENGQDSTPMQQSNSPPVNNGQHVSPTKVTRHPRNSDSGANESGRESIHSTPTRAPTRGRPAPRSPKTSRTVSRVGGSTRRGPRRPNSDPTSPGLTPRAS